MFAPVRGTGIKKKKKLSNKVRYPKGFTACEVRRNAAAPLSSRAITKKILIRERLPRVR